MPHIDKTTTARQVEMIIRQLNSVSTLPEAASGLLCYLNGAGLDILHLTEIIRADASLTAGILSAASQLGYNPTAQVCLDEALSLMPEWAIREALLSVKVLSVFEAGLSMDNPRCQFRRGLALHALATATASLEIAKLTLEPSQRELAFTAGLLHDIGKAALDEIMPKSVEQLCQQAQQEAAGLYEIEQQNLGLTHAVIGKRLCEKWNLPESISHALWLHHADAAVLESLPHGRLAAVVSLGDLLARRCGIGQSGSFDHPSTESLAAYLGLNASQIDAIAAGLPQQVEQRAKPLGLGVASRTEGYYSLLAQTAASMARDQHHLSRQQDAFSGLSAAAPALMEFLNQAGSRQPVETAGLFAGILRKTIHCGGVLVVYGSTESGELECTIADRTGHSNSCLLTQAQAWHPELHWKAARFEIIAADPFYGLADKAGASIDKSACRAAPLITGGRIIGAVLFEPPADDFSVQGLELLCAGGACALTMSLACRAQKELAERLAAASGKLIRNQDAIAYAKSIAGVAELAAGAAHEMNTPLAVISGRLQLLAQTEQDADKKQMLAQCIDRTKDVSDMIEDLMSYARPRQPNRQLASVLSLVADAADKTAAAHQFKELEIDASGLETLGDVYVDKAHILMALCAVMSNALESYPGGNGPIRIEADGSQTLAELRIIDRGCGMDESTLSQAMRPFFSAKPAGRQRGMGLSHAERLLTLNGGSLKITSTPGRGTQVRIQLPRV